MDNPVGTVVGLLEKVTAKVVLGDPVTGEAMGWPLIKLISLVVGLRVPRLPLGLPVRALVRLPLGAPVRLLEGPLVENTVGNPLGASIPGACKGCSDAAAHIQFTSKSNQPYSSPSFFSFPSS